MNSIYQNNKKNSYIYRQKFIYHTFMYLIKNFKFILDKVRRRKNENVQLSAR